LGNNSGSRVRRAAPGSFILHYQSIPLEDSFKDF
jgi:hypothetical protein